MIAGEEAHLVRIAVGQQLLTARTRAHLSQRGACDLAGLTQATLSNYEVGRRDIPLIALLLLARTYATDPSALIPKLPGA